MHEHDPVYFRAWEELVKSDTVSLSLIQRRLKIGAGRAMAVLGKLEADGVISLRGETPQSVLLKHWKESEQRSIRTIPAASAWIPGEPSDEEAEPPRKRGLCLTCGGEIKGGTSHKSIPFLLMFDGLAIVAARNKGIWYIAGTRHAIEAIPDHYARLDFTGAEAPNG